MYCATRKLQFWKFLSPVLYSSGTLVLLAGVVSVCNAAQPRFSFFLIAPARLILHIPFGPVTEALRRGRGLLSAAQISFPEENRITGLQASHKLLYEVVAQNRYRITV